MLSPNYWDEQGIGVDPIVYQPCAYGILIHSMWGEESEDKVFEEYKRINNLML